MQPAVVILCDELGEAYLTLALHLLYHTEQPAVIIPVAGDEVSRAAQQVMAVLRSAHEGIQLGTAVAAAHDDGLAPRLADGV